MTSTISPSVLKADLPEDIFWLEPEVSALLRMGAYVVQRRDQPGVPASKAAQGSTRSWGAPDVPQLAKWAPGSRLYELQREWKESPYDGDSFAFQLNLEEFPEVAWPEGCPRAGVVWVFINLAHCRGRGDVYFDPRPASQIVWHPRSEGEGCAASLVHLEATLPDATEKTLPSLVPHWDAGAACYYDWVEKHYRPGYDFQVGGWVWPIQGEFDDRNETFVCGLTHQGFGDSGAVYLHWSAERGFFVWVESC